jgi:hypothetical protein
MSWQGVEVEHEYFHPNIADNVAEHLNKANITADSVIVVENDGKGNIAIVGWVDDEEKDYER